MSQPAIVMHDVRKRYGGITALDGVHLEVDEGTVLGLLGPNGSGKTTTVNILSTGLLPDGGYASVCGHDVVQGAAHVRSVIGLAGQYAAVDPMLTGRENLTLVGRLSRLPRRAVARRVEELLERFGLTDAADRLARTYSGGVRRRLDLAAALVHRPPVVFLDEPTTGLDPQSRVQLWDTVRELVHDGATVLLTTQYLEEADALADAIVVLGHGRVVGEGTPQQLKQRFGTAIVELGFREEKDAARASARLAGCAFDTERDGTVVRLASTEGSAVIVAAVRALDGAAPDPVSVEIHEPTLDDVFLTLTGHAPATADPQRGTT